MPHQAAPIEGASVTEFQNWKEPPRSPWTASHLGQQHILAEDPLCSISCLPLATGSLFQSATVLPVGGKSLSAQLMQTWLWSGLGWTTVILSPCSSYLSGEGTMPHPLSKQVSTTCSLHPDSQAPISFPWLLLLNA